MARLQCYIAVLLAVSKFSECGRKQRAMEGFIVGGEFTKIDRFPHAVYLAVNCGDKFWMCGSSIVNQQILITAAHCLERCKWIKGNENIKCFAGHEDIRQANSYKVVKYKNHEGYTESQLANDISMVAVNALPLGSKIKRIIIPNRFPQNVENAALAGWGLTADQSSTKTTKKLKMVDQTIKKLETCENILGDMDAGTFCAGEIFNQENRPSMGDSGSGLIYNRGILIGVVSYRNDLEPGLIVYSNVTYFYHWIEKTAENLYCEAVSVNTS